MGNFSGSGQPTPAGKRTPDVNRKLIIASQDQYFKQWLDKDDSDDDDDIDINEIRARARRSKRSASQPPPANIDITKYEYPFESLVFEGGGTKGIAYCGAVMVLEELGVMPKIKRFGGASIGAITAMLLAVGFTGDDIKQLMTKDDLSKIYIDHSYGLFSLLPNLINGYGWNPGDRALTWMGNLIKLKTGSVDTTFKEVYDKFGHELCVVVTNLNMMTEEYFHPKTTPDVAIRLAVRMSMSVPGMYAAKTYKRNWQESTYVDGGVLVNYPIFCFDGWWLSMKSEDSFLVRMKHIEDFPKLFQRKERFRDTKEESNKTLGFLLFAEEEVEVFREQIELRDGKDLNPYPNTSLARSRPRNKEDDVGDREIRLHYRNHEAVDALLKALEKYNVDKSSVINVEDVKKALNDTEVFPKKYFFRLFGEKVTTDIVVAALDKNQDGKVDFSELEHLMSRIGMSLMTHFITYKRNTISGIGEFSSALFATLLKNTRYRSRDMVRTVGINTGYIEFADFTLESDDIKFGLQQGRMSTQKYLKYYIHTFSPPLKGESSTTDIPTTSVTKRVSTTVPTTSDTTTAVS